MKKFIWFMLFLVILAGIGYGAYYFWNKNKEDNKFLWGITVRPHALGSYSAKVWDRQLKLVKDLGVQYIRLTWQNDGWPTPFEFHDPIIDRTKKQGFEIYLVLEALPHVLEQKDPYMDGYNNGFQIASHYKGKIKYYQLLNEAASTALKGGEYSGESESDYDPDKYAKVRDWLKGASEGISKADPKAKKIINDQWTHYAFFDMIARDGIDYDILGWDWFSDMGLMSEKTLSDGEKILMKLEKFDKPIFLVEVNARPEGVNGQKGQDEEKQAEFIKNMAEYALGQKSIKGFFILELIDVTNSGRGYTDYYGIVSAVAKKNGVGVIGKPRKAFEVLKEIIKNNPS